MPKRESVQEQDRKTVYGDVKVQVAAGNKPLTCDQAKNLLGWHVITKEDGKKAVPLFTDMEGNAIMCVNNDHNRPLDEAWAKTLAQEILNRRWKFNLETIIIGTTGRVLSGQHRLIGLVLACQIWAGAKVNGADQKHHWLELWPEEPTIEALVAYGGNETPEYTRTLDNVRPRSLADVLFSDGVTFKESKYDRMDRVKLCRMLDFSVKMLWQRTGAKDDAFAPRRTHSEALEFIDRHPRLIKCVKHIFTEYGEGEQWRAASLRLSPGYAAGLMYLMAAGNSDHDKYHSGEPKHEKLCDWSLWDKAEEFWMLLNSTKSSKLEKVRTALGALANPDGNGTGTLDEKTGTICLAWRQFKDNHHVKDSDLQLAYTANEDGVNVLVEFPTVGGIDLGPKYKKEKPEPEVPEANVDTENLPTPIKEKKVERGEYSEEVEKANKRLEAKNKLLKNRETTKGSKNGHTDEGGEEKPAKRKTRKQIQEENTRKAKEADEAMAAEEEQDQNMEEYEEANA